MDTMTSVDASAASGTVNIWTNDRLYVEKAFTYTGSQGTDKLWVAR